MKPFNLEQALAGAPVQYRNGKKIKAFYNIPESNPATIITVDMQGDIIHHRTNGLTTSIATRDLFMAPVEVKRYQNIYSNQNAAWFLYKSLDDALTVRMRVGNGKYPENSSTIELTFQDDKLISVNIVKE